MGLGQLSNAQIQSTLLQTPPRECLWNAQPCLAEPPRWAPVDPHKGMNPPLEAADFCRLRKKEPLATPTPAGVKLVQPEAGS